MCNFVLIIAYDLTFHDFDNFGIVYTKPYCRYTPYAFGVLCGMIVVQFRTFNSHNVIFDNYAHNIGQFVSHPKVRYTLFAVGMIILNGLIVV